MVAGPIGPMQAKKTSELCPELVVFGGESAEVAMGHGFPDMQFRLHPSGAQGTMHAHGIGEEQVAGAGWIRVGGNPLVKSPKSGETAGSCKSWPWA